MRASRLRNARFGRYAGGSPGWPAGPHGNGPCSDDGGGGGGGGRAWAGGGGGAADGGANPPISYARRGVAPGGGATSGELMANRVSGGGDHPRSSDDDDVPPTGWLPRLRSRTKPTTAIPADTISTGKANRARLLVAVWHSLTNCFHWARAAARLAAGSAPAPMEPGLTRASMAVSEPFPGPQVPPTAGAGNSDHRDVRATATPNSPTKIRMRAAQETSERCFIVDHVPWP
jgi:hypothetical protein